MSALRAGILVAALAFGACDNIVGLKDIVPDGEAVALSIKVEPRGLVQQPLGEITVQVLDVLGERVTSYKGEIRLVLGQNPGSAALLGVPTATATDGVASFDLVGIDKPGTGYTLVASGIGLAPVTSAPIDVAVPRFTPVATGIPGGQVSSLVISPGANGGAPTLFAGAVDGVYRSVDGAASWRASSFGGLALATVTADPNRPGAVYLLGGQVLKKTVDGGATWRTVGGPNMDVSAFAINPRDSSVLYAVVNSALLRSDNSGETWSMSGTTIACRRLVVDAITSNTLYCATDDSTTALQKSIDGGRTWRAADNGLDPMFRSGLLVATPTGVFTSRGAQVYRSTDQGESWIPVASSSGSALAYAPSNPSRVYVAMGGVAVSNDGGATFVQQANLSFIDALVVDPVDPDLVYASGALGVFVSRDGGASWSLSSNGIDAHYIISVAMAPGAPNTVLASTSRSTLRTTNGGASWVASDEGNMSFHFDPAVSTRVYRCRYNSFATSTDSGATFTGGQTNTLVNSCGRLLVAGDTLISASSGSRLLRSTDRGATWTDNNLPESAYIFDAALGDLTGNVVVATTDNGVYRSIDAGASFTRQGGSLDNIPTIVVDPTLPTRLIAAQCPGVRISTNGGASFERALGGPCVHQLTATGSALYATVNGTSDTGGFTVELARSTDGGASWATVEITGIPSFSIVTSIVASDDGKTVYLGTPSGLYKGSFN